MFCILAAIFSSGCSSTDRPASAGFAAVVIVNQSVEQIQQAAVAVFQQNGYQAMTLGATARTGFEREATERENSVNTPGSSVRTRVKKSSSACGKNRTKKSQRVLVELQGLRRDQPGKGVFENTTALFGFQSGPYQKLLDQVAARLAMAAPTP